MNRISTSGSYSSVLANLMSAQARQATAQAQVATGKQATDLKGFGQGAEALAAAKALKSRTDGYLEANKALAARLEAQDLALNQVAGAATSAREAIANAVASGRADGLKAALQSALDAANQGLNAQFGGRYLFAGGQTSAPSAGRTLADLAAPPPGGLFRNDQLKPKSRIDDSTTVETGALAANVGGPLFETLRQVQALDAGALGPLDGPLTSAQAEALTNLLGGFDAARQGVVDVAVNNGLLQARLDKTQDAHTERATLLESLVGDLSEVDMAEAVSRLTQAQTAVQASAQVFATLRETSLLNLLR
jgi:flagellar hook-associated protein 3 FlgL